MEPATTAMVVGGGVKLLGDLYNSYQGGETEKRNLRRQRDAQNEATRLQMEGLDNIMALYGGSEQIQKEYADYLAQMKGFDPTTEMGQFDDSGYDVSKYLDPSMRFQLDEANRAANASLQGQGGLYSGKAMKTLQDRSQDYAMKDYGASFNRMTEDRAFGYQDYLNHFNNLRANKSAQLEQLKGLFNLSSTNLGNLASTTGQKANLSAQQKLALAGIQNQLSNAQFKQTSGLINTGADAIGMGAQAFGSMAGAPPTDLSSPQMVDGMIDYNFGQAANSGWDAAVSSPFGGYNPEWTGSSNFPGGSQVTGGRAPYQTKIGAF